MDELKEYCLKDVRLTKELYDLSRKQNFLMVPGKNTDETRKIQFANIAPAALL